MSDFYDRQGQPISMEEWAATYGSVDTRRVAFTAINDEVEVSTILMGIDHNLGDGPPLIFETMIFNGALDGECWRYATEAEARAGHEDAVAAARAAVLS